MGSVDYLQAIKPDIAYLRKVIENSLLIDWIIRIEYENTEQEFTEWSQWDKTFFAIQSAEPVLAALKDCFTKNANRAIRINAEKVRPQTHMIYQVYKPQPASATSDYQPRFASVPRPDVFNELNR